MFENTMDIFNTLENIKNRHIDCMNDCDDIVNKCHKVIMAKSKKGSLYGMCYPHPKLTKYFIFKGKVTKNDKNQDFVHYFDDEGKLLLTKRDVGKKYLNYIFYYYYERHIEVVWYTTRKNCLEIVGWIEYEKDDLIRFVESGTILKNEISSYKEYLFNQERDKVVQRIYAKPFTANGKPIQSVTSFTKVEGA